MEDLILRAVLMKFYTTFSPQQCLAVRSCNPGAGILLGLFYPEDGGDISFRNAV
jgi:hypothetical protein